MTLTANQLFKKYKEDGGSLNFANWLNTEKNKGVYPINKELNDEVFVNINNNNESMQNKTVLGFPINTLYIVGGIVAAAIIVKIIMKRK